MHQWPILHRFWERATNPAFAIDPADPVDRWQEEINALHSLGIAMEPALQFLYFQKPDGDGFRRWLLENRKANGDDGAAAIEDVLSADDLAFWDEHGYVVVRQAVSPQQCADARAAIWDFLQADADDPASWYRQHEGQTGLMLRLFDHPALDRNRESARIRNAYRQLYRSDAIVKTIDKVSFNPPEHAGFHFLGSGLHWDISLTLPIPFQLAGLLYLTDCAAAGGAFHCVPGFQRRIGAWLAALPAGADPRVLAPQTLEAIPVPGNAGDFVIWHQALPHCATANRSRLPRMVQYLTYLPLADATRLDWV
jgi:hypothetical protein